MKRWLPALGILLLLAACRWPADPSDPWPAWQARPWPAADALFRQDPRWLGADDAHSVDLGDGRVLWLFGDTFVEPAASGHRRRATLIRNSLGLQRGLDPTAATMTFFWRQSAQGRPAAVFPEAGEAWFWPGDGLRRGDGLVIFLARITPAANALGFALAGWTAVRATGLAAPVDRWHFSAARLPPQRFGITLGTGGVLLHQDWLYAYGCDADGRRAYLARWPASAVAQGDLRALHWWCGPHRGWLAQEGLAEGPEPLFGDAQAEFGVHFDPRQQRFVQIQTRGFGAGELAWRSAPRPEGPWGPLTGFYFPPEGAQAGVLIYAAKTHPFLTGAPLAVTYATNTLAAARLLADQTLYYPRFLRVHPGKTF